MAEIELSVFGRSRISTMIIWIVTLRAELSYE